MTVYVDHTPTGTEVARDVIWSRLWADTPAEVGDFAARLDVPWPAGARSTVIAEGARRRAILMGAIPIQPTSEAHGEGLGVAA